MTNFLGALVCFKQILALPQSQDRRVQHQIIQDVRSMRLPDHIFNKIVENFVNTCHSYGRYGGKCYSRAITGEPICAIIITDKEPWIAAITRSVRVEWPRYDISEERIFNLLSNYKNICEGNPARGRIDLTDEDKAARQQAKYRSPDEPKILRDTEGRDFMVCPLMGTTLMFQHGFRIQISPKGWTGIHPLPKNIEGKYRKRVRDVFTPDALNKLWNTYLEVERDPVLYDKYIKGDIVGQPIDHQHPIAIFHASLWKKDMSGWYGVGGRVPGILPVGTDGCAYKRETRLFIPAPENGARLLYKHEIPRLNSPKGLLENTKGET